jgi:hypothetical protein
MSTSQRKKLATQKAHAEAKKRRQYEKMIAQIKPKNREFTEYKPPETYRHETPYIPSLGSGVGNGFKKESVQYTGDLIMGIATMHKSNAVPVMRGTDQAKDIAQMRRN